MTNAIAKSEPSPEPALRGMTIGLDLSDSPSSERRHGDRISLRSMTSSLLFGCYCLEVLS